MSKTITVGPGYLGLALDDEGNIDDLLYGCREAFNNEGISKEWKVTSVAGRRFSPTLLLEKSKGVDYYELQFEKNKNFMNTKTWVANDDCIVKKVFKDVDLTRLANEKTPLGWTLNKATICAQKLKQHVGVYAGDDASYTLFAPMFDKVIKQYHSVNVKTNKAQPETYEKKTLPKLPEGAIVSTRIRTARNLADFPFTNNMTKNQRIQIESICKKVFDGFQDKRLKGTYYPMEGMTSEQRQELIDAHYLYINDDPTLELCGTYTDWPEGRGIFINDDRSDGVFIVWVGEEDQMRIMAMNNGSDVQAVWDLFYAGLEAVHKGVKLQNQDFAFKESHGYLSTCPTNLGTGMRASVHVNLPAFKTKNDLKKYVKDQDMKIDIRGTRGEATNTDGYTVYDVSNKERLGSDCYTQIKTMVDGVTALLRVK